jgi:tetratricopeptide (TPR) repeat protein
LNEVSEPEIQADINIIKSSLNDLREKVLLYYSLFGEEGVAFESPEPGRYRDVNNELRNDLLSIVNRVEELKRKARYEKSREKIEEVLEKISEIDEKLDEMEEAIEDYEKEVEEIIEDSGYRSVSELVNRENVLTSLTVLFENTIENLKALCGVEDDPNGESASSSNPIPSNSSENQIKSNPDDPIVLGFISTRDGARLNGIEIKFVSWAKTCTKWDYVACPSPSGGGGGGPGAGGGGCVMVAHAQPVCYACVEWKYDHVATTTSNSNGAYIVGLKKGGYDVYYSTPDDYPYPDIKHGKDIPLGVVDTSNPISGGVNLVLPYPYQYDNDHDNIDDRVEKVVAEHHNPWWSFDSKQKDGERFFPIHPEYYYTCAWHIDGYPSYYDDQFCDRGWWECFLKDQAGNCVYKYFLWFYFDPGYEELAQYSSLTQTEYYINAHKMREGHGAEFTFTTQDVFYNVAWRKLGEVGSTDPRRAQFRIQYYLFFNYNDTEVTNNYEDHFGDWEWLCVYPFQATEGVYVIPLGKDYQYPYGGRINWMHYHGHGARPYKDSECCVRYWDASTKGGGEDREVSVTRSEMEKRGLSNYIISWNGPDVPKVWVGDDVHSFWSGYGGVPRKTCDCSYSGVTFSEHINNCPAEV